MSLTVCLIEVVLLVMADALNASKRFIKLTDLETPEFLLVQYSNYN